MSRALLVLAVGLLAAGIAHAQGSTDAPGGSTVNLRPDVICRSDAPSCAYPQRLRRT